MVGESSLNANNMIEVPVVLSRPGQPAHQAHVLIEPWANGAYGVAVMHLQGDSPEQGLLVRKYTPPLDLDAALRLRAQTVETLLDRGFVGVPSEVPPVEAFSLTLAPGHGATLLTRLESEHWQTLSPVRRSRTVWRIGELRLAAAVPRLVELLGSDQPMLDYCIAWAIGRSGDPGACIAMDELSRRAGSDMVQRMARLAWIELAGPDERAAYAARVVADWPAAVRQAWADDNAEALVTLIDEADTWKNYPYVDWLEQLDQMVRIDPRHRWLLLREVEGVSFQAGYFRALRRIYKAAELRGDAEIWSILQHRFEQTSGNFNNQYSVWHPEKRTWVDASDEMKRRDSRFAYAQQTRNYLVRRGWRTLRRLGQVGSPEFPVFAFAALSRYDDATCPLPSSKGFWNWLDRDRGWQQTWHYYPRHSEGLILNRLLYRRDGPVKLSRHGGRSWSLQDLGPEREQRLEPLAEQWNRRPDLLLRLALESRAERVHGFAVRALADQPLYLLCLDDRIWRRLLNSTFSVTAEFAHAQLAARIAAETDPQRRESWLALLLTSRHEAIARAGLAMMAADPARHAASAAVVAAVLTARLPEVRVQARLLTQLAATMPGVPEGVVAHLLDWLENADLFTDSLDDITAEIGWAIANPLRAAAAEADRQRLLALFYQPSAEIASLAVDWLILHRLPPQDLPPEIYRKLLESDVERMLAAGLRLLGALPDAVLLTQTDLVLRFCLSPQAQTRQAALAVASRLAQLDPDFSARLFQTLLDALFLGESADGLHDHLFETLSGPLAASSRALPLDLMLRLLEARSRGAQRFGGWLLEGHGDAELPPVVWARLARHESLAIRQRALIVLTERFDDLGAAGLLPVLDSRWPDSRDGALALLRQRVAAGDWTAEQLIALCDHPATEVQDFGCGLLALRLAEGRDQDCLQALAQHPSLRLQRFVAAWLEKGVGDDPADLLRLRPYFLTVLSQVNRGRAAKTAVFAFLNVRAERSEGLAREVAGLFERLAVTVALTDRAQYIAGLYRIRQRYPALAGALTIHAPSVRGEA